MTHYSVKPRDGIIVKCSEFLSFAKNMSKSIGKNLSKSLNCKYSQNTSDHTKQSATDSLKLLKKESFTKQENEPVI